MRSRRWLSVVIVVLMVLTTLDITAYAQEIGKTVEMSSEVQEEVVSEEAICLNTSDNASVAFAGGDGTEENPYQIATAEQLASMQDAEGYFLLINDIDLSTYNDGMWEGIIANNGFVLDGNGHIIKNLTSESGLFESVEACTIENLTLENVICGAGGLIGSINNDDIAPDGSKWVTWEINISNCYVTGKIEGDGNNVGGLIGEIRNYSRPGLGGRIINNYAYTVINILNCKTEVELEGVNVGGLIGYVYTCSGSNSEDVGSATINIEKTNVIINGVAIRYGGGLIGTLDRYNAKGSFVAIESCTEGTIVADDGVGGMIGFAYNKFVPTFGNCAALCELKITDEETEEILYKGNFIGNAANGGYSSFVIEFLGINYYKFDYGIVVNPHGEETYSEGAYWYIINGKENVIHISNKDRIKFSDKEPTIWLTFETNKNVEYCEGRGYLSSMFDMYIAALYMNPLDNSKPLYENVEITLELPEGLSFSATEDVKTATRELGTMSLTETARQDMTFTVYLDNSYVSQVFEVKASVTADGYDEAYTDTYSIDVKDAINYDEYELLVYADYHDCTFGIGQTMNLIPAMVKDGKPLEGEEGWSYSIKDTSIAEITKYTETKFGPVPTITGNKAGTTMLTVVHIPTGRSVKLYLTIVEEHDVHNIKSLLDLPKDYGIYKAGMYMDEFSTERSGNGYNVKFNVYNGLQCHGAVEVYNSEGQITDIERIDKFDRYQTGFADVLASLGNLILTTADGTLGSYKNEIYSKETNIEVFVPDGGYIIISNNVTESIGAYIYNGVDLAFWAYSEGNDIAKAITSKAQSETIIESASTSVVEQYINAVKASAIQDGIEGEFQKKLYNSMKEDFTTDIVEGFGEAFINNTDELFVELDIDLWEEFKKSAISYGDSLLVEAFEQLGGPPGKALAGIFKTNEYLNVFMQLVDMEKTRDIEGIRINIDVDDDKLVSNNVIVENAQGLPIANNELVVVDISKKSESQYILEEFSRASQIRIYDITMYRDDKEVQPDGSIRVKIPVPALYNQEKCAIYRAEKDGSYTNMNAYYEDGYIVFVTTHLSTYVLVEEETLPTPTFKKIVNVVSGVHVYWNASSGAKTYNVYRSTNKTSGYTEIKKGLTATHYIDTTAVSGKTYYYKVVAVNGATTSEYSAPFKTITYVGTPDITSRANSAYGVRLGWNKISGATGYAIYRKPYSSGSWVRVATIKGNSTFTWTDSSVKANNGTVYKYTIRALAGSDLKTLSGCRSTGRTMTRLTSRTLNSAVKTSATSIKCNWTTTSVCNGYEVRFMVGSTVYKTFTVGNYKTGVKTFTGLKAGQTYKVQVRSYKKVEGVGTFYSAWSTAKTVSL